MLESFSPEPYKKIILEIIKTGFYYYFFSGRDYACINKDKGECTKM